MASLKPKEYSYNKGDPEDKTLAFFERSFLIPQRIRDVVNAEKCIVEAEALSSCKESRVLPIFTCVKFNKAFKKCIRGWYKDEHIIQRCTEEYLEQRSLMRMLNKKTEIDV